LQKPIKDPEERARSIRTYDLQSQVGYRLRVANQIAVELFADVLGNQVWAERVTTGQFAVLSTLWEKPGMAQTELAQHTSMDMPTLNGVLKRLAVRGLVDVAVDEADKRFRVIGLTAEGRDLSETLRAHGHLVSERILAPLPPEDRTSLLALLDKLIRAHRPSGKATGNEADG
jgi:DNA-binding MarR family transcriptional regulator